MKKIILVAAALVASVSAFAQVTVGAGYVNDASKAVYTYNNTSTTDSWASNGCFLQGAYSMNLAKSIDLTAGAKLAMLSGTREASANLGGLAGVNGTAKTTELYLAIPVTASYSYAISNDFKVFAYAGPTFALGLTSNTETTTTASVLGQSSTDVTTTNNYEKDSNGNCYYNRANLFVGAGVGVEVMKMVRLTVGYDLGLLNRTSADNTKQTQNQISVGISYLLF